MVFLHGKEPLEATIPGVAGKKTFTMYGLFFELSYKLRNFGDLIGL